MKNFIVTRSSVVFAESTCYLEELALINYQNQRLIYVIYVKKWSEKTTGSCGYGSAQNSDRASENYQSPEPRLRFRGQSRKLETRIFKALLFKKKFNFRHFFLAHFFKFSLRLSEYTVRTDLFLRFNNDPDGLSDDLFRFLSLSVQVSLISHLEVSCVELGAASDFTDSAELSPTDSRLSELLRLKF